jgi:uncharacterized protein (TIGR03000 family)
MLSRAFWPVVVCALLPAAGRAQEPTGPLGIFHNYGFPYGPRVAPAWNYPGIPTGGATVGYATAPGGGTHGILGVFGPEGPGHFRPRVPVYEPIPQIVASKRLVRQWQTAPFPGLAGYGWHGFYKSSPRPHNLNVSAWPLVGGPPPGPSAGAGAPGGPAGKGGGCLVLSVRVPQSTAMVLVDGKPTVQTGTERTFESPPLEDGQMYQYTVTARWVENGQVVEVSKAATGAPGAVVVLDFGSPAVATGK